MLYYFGDYELDEQLYQLRCVGKPVEIEPRVFNVLAYLLHHHDRVVSKDELLDKLWPDQVVTEAALTRCIVAARKTVGDDGTKQAVIETQHGRGYRFVAEVTEQADELEAQPEIKRTTSDPFSSPSPAGAGEGWGEGQTQPPPAEISLPFPAAQRSWSRRSVMLGGGLLLLGLIAIVQYLSQPSLSTQDSALRTDAAPAALPLPDKPSLVVLPFTNLSGDPEQDYFSDGMTEELITTLARFPSLFVIARHSAFTYKGKTVKVQEIGKELGVRYVLEGSVQRAEQRVRINARLVDALTGDHLWVERYDRAFSDIFTLQDEIVQKIVTTLKLQLTLQEQGVTVRKRTNNLEAYDYYLRGMEFFWRFTKETNAQARQMWEKAIALDSQYAEAYELLGATYYMEWVWRWNADIQNLERALVLAQQAVALDDSLPVAHSFLSLVYAQQQQYDQAITEGERAIALDPNHADSYAWQAEALNHAGRSEEALRMMKQAMRLNPRYPPVYLFYLGWTYRLTGRYTEAVTALKEALSRNPNHLYAHLFLAINYVLLWMDQQSPDTQTLEEALKAAQRGIVLNGDLPFAHTVLGSVYLCQKRYEQAITEMKRAIALDPDSVDGYAVLAEGLSRVGKLEEALQMAEQALRRKPSGVGTYNLANIGSVYYRAGRYEETIATLKQFLMYYPNDLGAQLDLAAAYSELGREAEARVEAVEVLRLNPNFSLEVHKDRMPIKDPAVLERHIAALRKAGLK